MIVAKNNIKKTKEETKEVNASYEKKTITKMVSIVLLIFMILYMFTTLVVGRKNNNDDKPVNEAIQYDEILGGSIFNQNRAQYYVMLYDFNSDDAKYVDLIIKNKLGGDDALKAYKVDLSNNFNNSIVGDNGNQDNDINKFKAKRGITTLIRVNEKGIELFIEGIDNIKNYFDY